MKKKLILILIFVAVSSVSFAQDEGGGVTGAEFLISPSSVRTDAMGGVADGLVLDLSSLPYNPSILALITDFSLQVSMTPYPNSVSDVAIQAAAPLGPGVLGINTQLFNVGEFTTYNASGVAIGTVSIFDAAVSAGYGYQVLDWLSAGGMLKGVYRGLGEYWAASAAVDLGAQALFETPHIGQKPKMETYEQVKARFDKNIENLEKELAALLEEATKVVIAADKEFTSANDKLTSLIEKRVAKDSTLDEAAAAKAKEKSDALEAEIAAQEDVVADLDVILESAKENLASEENNQKDWMQEQTDAAEQVYKDEIAYLDNITKERDLLYSVINDPSQGLTNIIIDGNIRSLMESLDEYKRERRDALRVSAKEYTDRRELEAERTREAIAVYESKIKDEIGDGKELLDSEIEELQAKIDALNASQDEVKEEAKTAGDNEDPEGKDTALAKASGFSEEAKLTALNLKTAESNLAELQKNTWVKRLMERISDKEADLERIGIEIEDKGISLEEQINSLIEDIDSEIEGLEHFQDSLKKDLRKSELQQELDSLNARSEKGVEKAESDFSDNILDIYTRLITAMYELEERIFQSRTDAAKENAALKLYDLNKDSRNQLIALEDDYEFAKRLQENKIKELEKAAGDAESPELEAAGIALTELEDTYIKTSDELVNSKEETIKEIENEEASNISAIRKERETVRLIYLQTDKPYRNTSFVLTVRNLGLPVTFEDESYPMPISIYTALGYSVVNIEKHRVTLSTMAEYSFFEPVNFGVGVEYIFGNMVFVRGGYIIGRPGQSITAGFGLNLDMGLSKYKIDYAFKPVTGYGYIHSFGLTAQF